MTANIDTFGSTFAARSNHAKALPARTIPASIAELADFTSPFGYSSAVSGASERFLDAPLLLPPRLRVHRDFSRRLASYKGTLMEIHCPCVIMDLVVDKSS